MATATRTPGAVRASAGLNTTQADIGRLVDAVTEIAGGTSPPVAYFQDTRTSDYFPDPEVAPWFRVPPVRQAESSLMPCLCHTL